MTTIPPFNPQAEDVKRSVRYILDNAPIQNLTEDEVLATIRLLQLEILLQDSRLSRYSVTVYRDDERLQNLTDDDLLLCMLLHCRCRNNQLLQYKLLLWAYGHTEYHWKKVVRRCPIVDMTSQTVEGQYGGQYLGRGYVIAKHILSLRTWIIENSKSEEYQKLKAR
jgi:hypothetical protein